MRIIIFFESRTYFMSLEMLLKDGGLSTRYGDRGWGDKHNKYVYITKTKIIHKKK